MTKFTKLATAKSLDKLVKMINEFAGGASYEVHPDTLQITNPKREPPEAWFVQRYRGGFLFGRLDESTKP